MADFDFMGNTATTSRPATLDAQQTGQNNWSVPNTGNWMNPGFNAAATALAGGGGGFTQLPANQQQTGTQGGWNVPQAQPFTPAPAGPGTDWYGGSEINPEQFGKGTVEQFSQYYSHMTPLMQLTQNAYQFDQQHNAQQQQWAAAHNWQQEGDIFNMGLAQRQQMEAERLAGVAEGQWGQQFGQQQLQDDRSWQLANQQQVSQNQFQQGQLGVWNQQAQTGQFAAEATAQYQQGQLQIQGEANRIEEMWRAGQLSNDQYANQTARLQQAANQWYQQQQAQTGQFGAETDRMQVQQTGQFQQGQLQLQQQANQIEQMWRSGQLSNDQYANETARLQQAAQQQFQQGQLQIGQFDSQTNRLQQQATQQYQQGQLQLEQMWRTGQLSNEQYANETNRLQQQANQWYQTQQAQIGMGELGVNQAAQQATQWYQQAQIGEMQSQRTAEQQMHASRLEAEREMAAMQAFGRRRSPNARWQRSF